MNAKKLPVFWNGQFVGSMLCPLNDHFDLYGDWEPFKGTATTKFLEALEAGEQLEVTLGDKEPQLRGTVEEVPAKQIEVKYRP